MKFKSPLCLLLFVLLYCFPAHADSPWKRNLTVGYNQSNGNTDKAEFSLGAAIAKALEAAEFSSKLNIYYAESDGRMDSQKWDSVTRYAYDFGPNNKWFNSYSLTVDHDRFTDIDYRMLPAVGLGYWFARQDDWTWSLEGSVGYEITKYRSTTPDDESATFIARNFMKKKILENAFITEDFSFIPSLEGKGNRLKSETAFTNPLRDNLDLSVKYIMDHDSEPAAGKKKTDTRFVTGLTYSF